MTPKLKFTEGEKVLCFHGPLIYEAKALKSTITKDKQIKYYIHYAGWNKNWDEWVPENRVLKYNEANVQRQKEVFKQHSSSAGRNKKATPKGKKGEVGSATPKDGASSGGSESRASTPSKELNATPLAAPTTSRNRSKSTATPVTPTNTITLPTASTKETISGDVITKRDQEPKEDIIADYKDLDPQKKKRGAASLSSSEKSTASSAASITTSSSISGSGSVANPPNVTPTSHSVTQRLDACVESEEHFLSKVEVKIKIPDDLKQCLADDWDAITRQHKLIDIPAKITVQDIIDQYVAFKKTSKSTNASKEVAINDVLNGVIEYFNVMLGSQLLYKFERPQYAEILHQHPETPLSKLYGAFHLLRLFVKLGSMLGFSALDEKSMQTLLGHLNDFLKFLVKNSATYFSMTNFVNVSPEYHRNTQ